MKNIKHKVPTIIEWLDEVEQDNQEFNDIYILDVNLANICIKLLGDISSFHLFLYENKFEKYYLPTSFFAQIKYYIEECLETDEIKYIEKILQYLGKLEDKNDSDLSNVIYTGLLENYDRSELEIIWKYIPDSLRKSVTKRHPEYSEYKTNIYYG